MFKSLETALLLAAEGPPAQRGQPPFYVILAFSGTVAVLLQAAGIVLGLTLFTVFFVSLLEALFDTNRWKNYFLAVAIEITLILGLWFVIGLPEGTNIFLQWLGVILIQVFLAVVIVELLSQNGVVSQKRGYCIAVLLIIIVTAIVRML